MCGIAGLAGGAPPERALLERMAATMENRGPDGEGIWADETAGLAFRRLAIIDLHERSNQPLHLGPLHLVFNGEIYNYRELRDELRALGHEFETEGDGEVLLHAWAEWGEGALDRYNGMFAFAIWDDGDRSLTLAADPFGEKPLYYAETGGRLVFGSEIKAILHWLPAAVEHDALALFLTRGSMPEIHTSFFRGIRRLPAAQVLRWQDGRSTLRRYWTPRRVEAPGGYGEAVERVRELLLDSIRLRLRSDVPVGTSLSGGVDSSTVVALSARLAGDHRRHAFTARFRGFERDEWQYAAEVAESAGVVEHHSVEPTAHDLLGHLDRLVLDHEEPVGSLSIYAQWRVMEAAKEAGVTVLLDGQGGDELFAGYPTAVGYALRSLPVRAAVRELAGAPRTAALVAQAFAMDHLPNPARRLYRRRTATAYAARELVEASAPKIRAFARLGGRNGSPLARELLAEAFDTSLPNLLRYADRSSMAHSREVRLPFLDRRIAELALSLPASFLYENGVTKRVLRDAARGLVPETVLARRDKVGFEPPQQRWLAEPGLRKLTADVLLDPAADRRGLYDRAAIEEDFRRGEWRDSDGIWRALNAELWLRALID